MLMQWIAGRLTKVGLKINIHDPSERLSANICNARRKVESSNCPAVSIVSCPCLQTYAYLTSKHVGRIATGLLAHVAQRF